MIELNAYQPRIFRFRTQWKIEALLIKFYTITRQESTPIPAALLENALEYAKKTLSYVREEEGPDHQLGYAMLHMGEMSNWLLIHWWAHQDVALRLLAAAPVGSTSFVSQDDRRFHACVWEHVVIDHERQAWVRNMMQKPNNAEHYLQDRLNDGAY